MVSAELAGHLVEAVLAVMAVEFVALSARQGWRAERVVTIALALAPGLFLVMALRLALGGASFVWTGLCVALSLPFHIADLHRRGLFRPKEKAGDR